MEKVGAIVTVCRAGSSDRVQIQRIDAEFLEMVGAILDARQITIEEIEASPALIFKRLFIKGVYSHNPAVKAVFTRYCTGMRTAFFEAIGEYLITDGSAHPGNILKAWP
ncbi:hypothetical protein SDC9_84149 [bioreactor metagenome]|uniref:Uncharacterized protein n=1 Tax=bioreactor metagenome TaxID=1076179 RepID=A0A644ZCC5_9ZZZZ